MSTEKINDVSGATLKIVFDNDFTLVSDEQERFEQNLCKFLSSQILLASMKNGNERPAIGQSDIQVKKLSKGSIITLLEITGAVVTAILALPINGTAKTILVSTAAGFGGGAALGFGFGTVVPVAGNGIGAIIGGVTGGVVGFAGGVIAVIV